MCSGCIDSELARSIGRKGEVFQGFCFQCLANPVIDRCLCGQYRGRQVKSEDVFSNVLCDLHILNRKADLRDNPVQFPFVIVHQEFFLPSCRFSNRQVASSKIASCADSDSENHNHRPCRWFAQAPLGPFTSRAYRLIESSFACMRCPAATLNSGRVSPFESVLYLVDVTSSTFISCSSLRSEIFSGQS